MKTFAFALLTLALALPAQAENWIQNGDFTDGITHWHGDARSPADFAGSDPFAKPDPFTSKGMIIPLKKIRWVKVQQDFKGKLSSGVLSITYMLSQDVSFSDKQEDYTNIPEHIDFSGWKQFNMAPGEWMAMITDFGTVMGQYYKLKPEIRPGPAIPQTYRLKISGLTPLENKTITLAFPPGKGIVVLLNVSLNDDAK